MTYTSDDVVMTSLVDVNMTSTCDDVVGGCEHDIPHVIT